AENYMVAGGPFHHYLGLIRAQYPLSLHGVGLSIGGEGPLDRAHLARLARLIERYQPHTFSEHLAWSTHGPVFLNDLLPLAYDVDSLNRVCEHVDQVQSFLKRPMLLENPSTYLQFQRSTLDETDFISETIRRTGCGLLLDVNNVYVSCINHQRDPLAYIDALPLHAVAEIHLAGFAEDTDSLGERLLIDDHGAPIDNAVWQLYEHVLARTGPVATLIERDNQVPAFGVLLAEAQQAERYLLQVRP
ncbi:MNIO family bufferin maturase, partial [Pseudomonas sp.]|uniref:MNIO family bufferin maturase n=1 Tax=Pseudomonas sp. TaxID=306 RepID=UPI003FD6EF0F